jgi:hypothetical protein
MLAVPAGLPTGWLPANLQREVGINPGSAANAAPPAVESGDPSGSLFPIPDLLEEFGLPSPGEIVGSAKRGILDVVFDGVPVGLPITLAVELMVLAALLLLHARRLWRRNRAEAVLADDSPLPVFQAELLPMTAVAELAPRPPLAAPLNGSMNGSVRRLVPEPLDD